MSESDIVIKGAREHNLRSVGLTLPRGRLICFTGVSGSGKSSLAFDTLYAEGRRRYVESLSSYARQFLGTQEKPEVDAISGLAPTISIQQKTAGDNPRSTVGTVTQIYDFLRVLFARLGVQHCTKCGQAIAAQTAEQITGRILAIPEGTKFQLLAPVVRGQKGENRDLLEDLRRQGYARARVDGKVVGLSDNLRLDKMLRHNIELVLDRLTVSPAIRLRLGEAVDEGLRIGEGVVIVAVEGQPDLLLSSQYACAACGLSYEAPSPQLLSFNSPIGMCLTCDGLGVCTDFDAGKLIPDDSKSFDKGAILTHAGYVSAERKRKYESVARSIWFSLKSPWRDVPEDKRKQFLYGTDDAARSAKTSEGRVHYSGGWEGIIGELRTAYKAAVGDIARKYYEKFMVSVPCPDCKRARLNPQALAVRIKGGQAHGMQPRGLNIAEACDLSIADAQAFFSNLELTPLQRTIGGDAIKEIVTRLQFLINVGLEYLTLDRAAPTLSGGEAQRIRLAAQVGCGLVGVLYILDEPSIGLHPRDNTRLINALKTLRDMGNTVIVVEHDEETMRAADQIVDFGPGPGVKGGEVVFQGGWDELLGATRSETADYLTGRKQIAVPKQRRPVHPPGTAAPPTPPAMPTDSKSKPAASKRTRKSPAV